MKKTFLLVTLTTFIFICTSQAQTFSGVISDTVNRKTIENAVIALLKPGDSILYKFVRTNKEGAFEMKNVKPGKYVLMVTHPYFADFLDDINVTENGLNLKSLAVIPKSKLLQEVIVKTGSPIKIKGDTVVYTADSFKVEANANVEDLLKKLPGIQVDKDGKIKAMGEQVKKVLVDGEEFFGDDPGMAVKNLRADAVKEVQVFDKKSEQSEFTGIDDGKTQKTINLKLKEDKKKGYFGKIDLAGGLMKKTDNRFNNNLMFNAFKGKRKVSAYFLQGNTGQNGLNWQDQQKFGGEDENTTMEASEDGGIFITRTEGGDDEPYIDTRNGYFDNLNAGLQYSNKWNEKHNLNFSPKFNKQQYTNTKTTYSQVQLSDTALFNENAVENTIANKRNVKNNLIYEFKIDSSNTLKVVTRLNLYHSDNSVYLNSENSDIKNAPVNSRISRTDNTTDKTSFANSVIFKHKFKKDRRTFSFNTDFNLRDVTGTSFLYSKNTFYKEGRIDTIDQKKTNATSNRKLLARGVYTEPLSKRYSLELNYELSWLNGNNDLITLSKTTVNDKYDNPVDSLTNHFKQNILTNKAGFKISYKYKKFKYSLGSAAGFTNYDFQDITKDTVYKRNFTNLFPEANLDYTYKPNHNIRFNYNGNTIQPTISQLQQLINNTNTLYQYIGNPNLKQSFQHNFSLSHNFYNFVNEIWMYQSINANITDNAITQNVKINPLTGETLTQPVNTGGNYSMNGWLGGGKKLKKLDLYLNINGGFNYSKFVDLVNDVKNNTENTSYNISIGFNKFKEKKYDFWISNDFGFNRNKSSIYNRRIKYNTYSLNGNASFWIKKVWKIGNDIEYNYRQKTDEFGKSLNNTLWNATLERNFRKDEFTVFFTVRDILNQNIGIDRTLYGNTLREVRNDRLQRFWLLGFRWNFKNKSAAAPAPAENK